ncbi:MAG TPA: transcription initiation factor IIB [Candidatus Syntrophoarchaeum butanivorans]|uniref:Transcription initiation factor IIB n=2 Tax=Candidatus Syntropharchaeum butanivorans TaxID=1839936 RepID=A0A7J2S1C4_9EURY|nr:transcription initiation factor IIB [Candidatus Syntrophoarchaeum butanivorans]
MCMIEADKNGEEEKKVYRATTKCPECDSPLIRQDYERGEIVCDSCGLVIEENLMDQGAEWRAFDYEQMVKRARTGAPMTYMIHDKGLSTFIDWRDANVQGKSASNIQRLRKWQNRVRVSSSSERSLIFAISEIDRMGSALGLSKDVREAAALMYRKAMEKDLIRGRSVEGLATAILYAVCRQKGIPRTLEEVGSVSRVKQKEIGRTYRFLSRELDFRLQPSSPSEFVSRFCSRLNLKEDVRAKAIEIVNQAEQQELTVGKGPISIAAAAIYIAARLCGDTRTQKEVAAATGVTEVTIRNRYKDIVEALGIELPQLQPSSTTASNLTSSSSPLSSEKELSG